MRKRFSMMQVVVMLTVMCLSVAAVAYAGVTVPNTFSSGTTAKASEVNANFQALATAMPAVKQTSTNVQDINFNWTSGSAVQFITVTASIHAPVRGATLEYAYD